jgi:hypothetical protein
MDALVKTIIEQLNQSLGSWASRWARKGGEKEPAGKPTPSVTTTRTINDATIVSHSLAFHGSDRLADSVLEAICLAGDGW